MKKIILFLLLMIISLGYSQIADTNEIAFYALKENKLIGFTKEGKEVISCVYDEIIYAEE